MPGDERHSLGKDLEATLAARSELGREYEPALVESFLERIDRQVEERVQAEVAARARAEKEQGFDKDFVYSTMGIGIPLTAVAGVFADLPGIIVAWAGIVGVNLAAAWGSHRRRTRG